MENRYLRHGAYRLLQEVRQTDQNKEYNKNLGSLIKWWVRRSGKTSCVLEEEFGYQEQHEAEQGGRKARHVFENRAVASLVGAHFGKQCWFGLPMER